MACRQVKAKRELIRLVPIPDGNIEVDSSGKEAGRGAYLCRSWACWQNGLKGNQLERALRRHLSPENRAQLMNYASTHLKGAN